jgi:hypothetical protein
MNFVVGSTEPVAASSFKKMLAGDTEFLTDDFQVQSANLKEYEWDFQRKSAK